MKSINEQWIRRCVAEGAYYYTSHADEERMNDALTIMEVEQAMANAKIIEYYEDSGRGESCLVVGFTAQEQPVHAVCGVRHKSLVLVTIYVPGPPKFVTPFQRGEK